MKEYLSNRQVAFVIFGIIVGYGVIALPKTIIEKAGTGGWFALLIAVVIGVFFTYIFTYLGYTYENETLDEYSEKLTGKFVTFIFVSIFIIYFFSGFTVVTRIVSEAVNLTILQRTPVWALSLLILLVSYYAVTKGLRNIARVCEIYGIIVIIGFMVVILSMLAKGKLINLKPFFVLKDIKTYFKVLPVTAGPLVGMELISIIPFNRKINNKKIFMYTFFMIVFIGILYILEVEAYLSIMGDSSIFYKDALLTAIRRIEIRSLQFLRRLDGIFIIVWLMAVFTTVTIWAYGTVFFVRKYCKKIHINILAFIVIVISFIMSRIPQTVEQAEKIYQYTGYLGFVAAGIIPLILFVITKIKKYKQKT